MTDAEQRHPGGRPSKYEPEYCDRIVSFMDDGYSIASFAAEIGVARSTINKWAENYPEFSEALSRAQARRARWWEDRLRTIARDGGGPGASTAAIFGIKNAAGEDYREKQEIEHSGGMTITHEDALDELE